MAGVVGTRPRALGLTLAKTVWVHPGDVHFSQGPLSSPILHPKALHGASGPKGFNPTKTKQTFLFCPRSISNPSTPLVILQTWWTSSTARVRGGPRAVPHPYPFRRWWPPLAREARPIRLLRWFATSCSQDGPSGRCPFLPGPLSPLSHPRSQCLAMV